MMPASERAVLYSNVILGTSFGPGAAEGGDVRVYSVEKADPEFFRRAEEEQGFDPQRDPVYAEFKRDPDVIAAESVDQFPDEFDIAETGGGQGSDGDAR